MNHNTKLSYQSASNGTHKRKETSGFLLAAVCCWLVSAGISTSLRAEQAISFSPKIRSVTVYPDRALVFRSAVMELDKGRHRLIFRSASPDLENASLRAFAKDPAIIVQGINSWVERKTETIDPRIRKLEKRLEALEREEDNLRLTLERLKSELSGIKDYEAYLKRSIGRASRNESKKKTAWQEALSFLSKRKEKSLLRQEATKESIEKNKKEIQLVRQQLSRLQRAARKFTRIVELHLQATRPVRTRVGFAYMMRRASWQVSYGMHYKAGRIEVDYFGNIRQLTGEDWNNVQIRLSTSRPATGAARPTISALSVRARTARTRTEYVGAEEKAAEEPVAGTESGASTDADKGTGGYAGLEARGNSVVFQIPRRARIPSSKRRFRLTIARFTLKPKEIYNRIVGARQETAYKTARLVNNRPFPMLAGQVDVYQSSGFMGRSRIRHTPSGGSFLLNLGSNRNIAVERVTRRYRKTAGVLSSRKVFVRTIRIRLENRSRKATRIGLLERIPVSETEDVKIRISSGTSAGYKETPKDSGILRWDFSLRPGQKKEVVLTYEVEAPPDFPEHLIRGR